MCRVVHRGCTRSGCRGRAVATLTYAYADEQAVLGALAPERTPGAYDLCRQHAASLSVPQGWEVIRLPDVADEPPAPSGDDLLALADAVREVGLRHDEVPPPGMRGAVPEAAQNGEVVVLAERRHLRVLADAQRGLSRAGRLEAGSDKPSR